MLTVRKPTIMLNQAIERDYVLIGGGLASAGAAQAIRARDASGTILIIGQEKHLPYDRPPLSKTFLTSNEFSPDDAASKEPAFYPDNAITVTLGVRATAVDRAARTVTLDNGQSVKYGKLLLATGASAVKPDLPGSDLEGVHLLRTLEDSQSLRTALESKRNAVILGAGYIGMEVAAACIAHGVSVTVVEPEDRPWSKFASKTLGKFLTDYFAAKGVTFIYGEKAAQIQGSEHAEFVITDKGRTVPCDFVVAGVGAKLNTDLAKESGLEVDPKQGVRVNASLLTADPNIWAAGDIAYFDDTAMGQTWHTEHYLNAKWQGPVAGANMAGASQTYDKVPYFFSDILDVHMILRGAPVKTDTTKILGDLTGAEFIELYANEQGILRTGIAISRSEPKLDKIADVLETLIRAKTPVTEINGAQFD